MLHVFKGGTALKKCYLGNARFSEDLDFTALRNAPTGNQLDLHIDRITKNTENMMNEYAPIVLTWQRYQEKQPHPEKQEAFKIRAQFPNQHEPLISTMIEISFAEELFFEPIRCPILHEYEEDLQQDVLTYSLEEIVCEKLRGILQHTKKLHEKNWTRSRTRDYYDLYKLSKYKPELFSPGKLVSALIKKCKAKNVMFQSVDDFFDPRFLAEVHKDWQQHLGHLVDDLPPLQTVLSELRKEIKKLIHEPS